MTDGNRTRRRFLATSCSALLLGAAGCSGQSDPADPPATGSPTASPTDAATATSTDGHGHDHDHGTDEGTDAGTEEPDAPGYKDYHWHGRMFFEIDGELVDFYQDKYFLKNIDDENPEAVYFHFHEPKAAHGPNEWSNEKKVINFDRALNLLPGIGYEQQSGNHVVTYEGTTYDGGNAGTTVEIKEGTESIDPPNHQVAHNDDYYIKIRTEDRYRDVDVSAGDAELGTLIFDMNNRRIDFASDRFVGQENASEAFHFRDDGYPNLWYKNGSVTLEEALNSLNGIQYAKHEGSHAIKFEDEERKAYAGSYFDSDEATEIIVRQRTNPVDPTTYELREGDIIWVYVHSEEMPDNEH